MDQTRILVLLVLVYLVVTFAHWGLLAWLSPRRLDAEGRRMPIPGMTFGSFWTDHDPANYSPEVRGWVWPLRILFALSLLVPLAAAWVWF